MKSQREDVYKYLKTHSKGITQYEAIKKFGATRLSAIIYDLKRKLDDNEYIETTHKTVKTRYGRKTSIAVYKLKERS